MPLERQQQAMRENFRAIMARGLRFEEALPLVRSAMEQADFPSGSASATRWDELLGQDFSADKGMVALWLRRAFPLFAEQPPGKNAIRIELGAESAVFALLLQTMDTTRPGDPFPEQEARIYHGDYRAEELSAPFFSDPRWVDSFTPPHYAWLWLVFVGTALAEKFRGVALSKELAGRPLLHLVYDAGGMIAYGGTITPEGWRWRIMNSEG